MKARTKEFIKLLKMTQDELFDYLVEELKGFNIEYNKGNYIYITTTPHIANKPLLTAHLDTVDTHRKDFKVPEVTIVDGVLHSVGDTVLGGDDRAGVWLMLQLLKDPDVFMDYDYLFCCDEEIGGHGSTLFAKVYPDTLKEYSSFISLDRAGVNDVATYGYDNDELIKVFEDIGFQEAFGTFTDCVNLSEVSNVACVNLSVGCFNEHTASETQDLNVMYNLLEILKSPLIRDALVKKKYEATYKPKNSSYSGYSYTESINRDPHLCECCGQHLPLYSYDYLGEDLSLCEDCVSYYDFTTDSEDRPF